MKKIFFEFWQGQRPLWQAFWLLFVLGQIFFILMSGLVFWLFFEGPYQKVFPAEVSILPHCVVWFLFILYASVSVWRCGAKTSMALWVWSSRIFLAAYLSYQVYDMYWLWMYWVPKLKKGS